MNKRKNNQKGITLIALILTIIIMIILAGISTNAIVGENGILNQAKNAGIKSQDASAQENLEMAWAARMSKFYEDIANGKATWDDIGNYFSEKELNNLLGDNNKIIAISYNEASNNFQISYESSDAIPYSVDIQSSGKVTRFERTDRFYSDVWVSYYEVSGIGTLTYASSKDIKLDGQEPVEQWDITEGFTDYDQIPWIKGMEDFEENENYEMLADSYIYKINNVKILDKITPKRTTLLFYALVNVENIENLENLDYSYYKAIGDLQFTGCIKLKSVDIPDTVTWMYQYAFYNCQSLENIKLSNNLERISKNSFEKCTSLKKIEFPNSLSQIGREAFIDSALEEVTINENITRLEHNCFYNCKNLNKINYNAISVDSECFFNEDDDTYSPPFISSSDNIEYVIIGDKVKKIPDYIFAQSNVKKVILSNTVETIGNSSFTGCAILENVVGGNSIKVIERYAFYECPKFSNIEISNCLETIGKYAFYHDELLEEIYLPDTLTEIGDYAFRECKGLTELTIPENLQRLGAGTFAKCENIENLYYNAKDLSQSNYLINETSYVGPFASSCKNIIIGSNVTEIPSKIFTRTLITSIILPEGVTKIESQSFNDCSNLTYVSIPSTIVSIMNSAFQNCTNLQTIRMNRAEGTFQTTYAPWTYDTNTNVNIIWNS